VVRISVFAILFFFFNILEIGELTRKCFAGSDSLREKIPSLMSTPEMNFS